MKLAKKSYTHNKAADATDLVGPRTVVVYKDGRAKAVGRVLKVVKHSTSETARKTRVMWQQPYSVAASGAGVKLLVAGFTKGRGGWLEYKHGSRRREIDGSSNTVVASVRLVQEGKEDKWRIHPSDYVGPAMRGLCAVKATAAQVAAWEQAGGSK